MAKIDPRQPLFMAGRLPDGTPMIMVGIPTAGWDHIKTGNTLHFDLTAAGFPTAFAIFGGDDQASIMKVIEEAAAKMGMPILDERRRDMGIPGAPNVVKDGSST